MDGWIKLFRKLLENDVIRDERALQIFIWLLLKVDRTTGVKKIARSWACQELNIKPTTFYDALQRLVKKYKMATAVPTANYTIITIINWYKYQMTDSSTDICPTARRQHADTLQEYKNKELRSIPLTKGKTDKLKCPLGKERHKECIAFLEELAHMKNLPHGWLSMGKQLGFLHKLIRAGYVRENIRGVAKELDDDKYWWDKWDLGTILSYIEKKGK